MKARKLELKEVELFEEVWNTSLRSYNRRKIGIFAYRSILREVLTTGGEAGLSTEEVIKSVLIFGRLKDCLSSANATLLLDQEDYAYLLVRLNKFRWALTNEVTADFITYVRNLAEVEVEEKQPTVAQPV